MQSKRRRGGRAAEGGGLLNRCRGQNSYRGFESPPLRQISPNSIQRRDLLQARQDNFKWLSMAFKIRWWPTAGQRGRNPRQDLVQVQLSRIQRICYSFHQKPHGERRGGDFRV